MAVRRETMVRLLLLALALAVALARLAPGAARHILSRMRPAAGAYHEACWKYPGNRTGLYMHALTRPFSEVPEWGARHNSHGFRAPEYTMAHPPGVFRILILGDSVTWGQGVGLEDTYARRLAGLFQKHGAKPERRVEVIALGVCGSRFADNFMRLLVHGRDLKPDLIIFQFLANDVELSAGLANVRFFSGVLPLTPPRSAAFQWLVKETALGRLFYERGRRIALEQAFSKRRREAYDPRSRDWRTFLLVLQDLKAWNGRNRVPVAFAAFPDFDPRKTGRNFKRYTELGEVSRLPQQALAAIRGAGFPVLDLTEAYGQRAGDAFLCVAENDAHPNALAHAIAAQALYDYLTREKLVDRKGAPRPPDPLWETESRLRAQAEKEWAALHANPDKALEFFLSLQMLYPQSPWVAESLADTRARMGQRKESKDLYASLVRLEPSMAAPWFHLAQAEPDRKTKERLLKRMLAGLPEHAPSWEALAGLYKEENRTERACACFRRLAQTYQNADQFTRAMDAIEKMHCAEYGQELRETP